VKIEEVNKWLGLIKLSQFERENKQPNWDKYFSYFRGLQWEQERNENRDLITVNLVYSQVKVELPSIYFKNPKLFIKAIKPSAVYRARIQEIVLNQDMEVMDLKSEIRKAIVDVILFGTSFLKTTYFINYDEESLQPGDKGQILNLVNRFAGNPIASVDNEQPAEVGENGPQSIRTSPYNVAFRVGAHDLRDPGFIAIKSRLYVEDVKNDKYYKNTEDLQPNVVIRDDIQGKMAGYWGPGVEDASAMVDAWEIWDIDKNRKFVLVEGHDKPIVPPDDNPYPYDHPLDILKFTDIPEEMWGMSEVEPALPQIDELNVHRTIHLRHSKKYAARKTLIKRGIANDEETKEALRNGEDTLVEIDGNPTTDANVLEDAPLPADTYRFMSLLKDDIVEVQGITPYKRGLLQGADTATEANIAENNSQSRDSDRVDLLGACIKRVMRKVRLCRKEFTPGEYIVQITDDVNAGKLWEVWNKETFTDDIVMDIEYGSTLPQNAQTKMTTADALYDRLIQNPTINPQAAAAKLLEAHEEGDITSWFLPPEIIQQQLMAKVTGQQTEQKGVAPGNGPGQGVPPTRSGETPAELGGSPLKSKGANAK
jgi:hypothetical protein